MNHNQLSHCWTAVFGTAPTPETLKLFADFIDRDDSGETMERFIVLLQQSTRVRFRLTPREAENRRALWVAERLVAQQDTTAA
jgi:hypothetical protein